MKIIVDTPETQQQTATIHYTAPRPVNIGNVFYTVENAETKDFYEPCRVCGDKRELTLNGVTFKCPCCNTGKQAIHIHNYAVRRFRVHHIEDAVGTLDWKPSDWHTVKFYAYRKIGGGHYVFRDNGGTLVFTARDFCNRYNKPFISGEHNDGIYDDYKTALQIAAQMNEAEINRLIAYNAENGTNYAVEFTPKHDPKSN